MDIVAFGNLTAVTRPSINDARYLASYDSGLIFPFHYTNVRTTRWALTVPLNLIDQGLAD